MKKKDKLYKLESWEILVISTCIILLLLIVIADYVCNCLSKMYPLLFSTLIGVLTGVISAITVLFFQQLYRNIKLYNHYFQMQGEYTRIDCGLDNKSEENLKDFKGENNGLRICLRYLGDNTFNFDAEYWKTSDAKAAGSIEFNENNKMIGPRQL